MGILGITYDSVTGALHCFQKGLKEQNNESIKLPALLLEQEKTPAPAAADLCIHPHLPQACASCDGTIRPPNALNLCLPLLAQKSDALIFFLTLQAENEFGDECTTLGCSAPVPWAARALGGGCRAGWRAGCGAAL